MKKRTAMRASWVLSAAILTVLLNGCGSDGNPTSFEGNSTVTLQVNGLEPIVGGMNYQAWLVVGDENNFFGYPLLVFNIDAMGRMVHPRADTVLTGPYQADVDAGAVLGVAVSLEVTDTLLQYSSITFIMGGELVQGTADLRADDWIALNRDFSGISGEYVLSTPTDEAQDDELSGIWFVDSGTEPFGPGLNLPDAPKGWTYEGWVEVDGVPYSTGKFVSVDVPDSAATYSGTIDAPQYPGEDFVYNAPQGSTFPLDLSGATVFISAEPQGPLDVFPSAPFFVRLLEGHVPASPAPLTVYSISSKAGQLPSGTATVQKVS